MKKRNKIMIGIVVVIGFVFCFTPVKSNNTQNKLDIISSYGDNEAYHPKVLSFENGWNGYKYWMSYTPYPQGDDSKENPHIAVSNNLKDWKTMSVKEGGLDDISNDEIKDQYNSDAHIVYNSDTNEMECYWRFVDDVNNKAIIYRRKTSDGVNWTKKEVTAYSNDRKNKDYVSPAIIYENEIYKMWYVDKENTVKYATSTDGIKWQDKQTVTINYDENLKTWHLDVIHTKKGYEMLIVAFDKWENHNKMNLYYTSSQDGVNWDKAKTIIEPAIKTNNWDNLGIYRSSFIYENNNYYVFYSGTNRTYHHGIGLVYGEDIYNLKEYNVK